ncbi:MAG: hypothetical protein GY839_10165 [candidate division Zixibacteria bacterium]|nr:hypothetical protein [candidate division Zixibacteria bacterium]
MLIKKLSIPFFLILIIPLLIVCGGGPAQKASEMKPKPGLFDDPLKRYPNQMYIASVGSGDTQEIAKDRATGDIAKVIQADIRLQQRLVEEYFESGTGADMKLEKSSNFNRQIDITAEQSLQNVNIGRTWLNENDGLYYAVAYMDRDETATIYQQQLAKIDADVTTFYNGAQQSTEKLTRLAFINKAMALAVQRDVMTKQLNTISLGTQDFTPNVKPADLIMTRQAITRDIAVKLDLDYETWDEFPGAVGEVLQAFGFQIAEGEPDVTVTGNMKMTQLEREGYFVRWFVELHFTDMSTAAKFLTYTDDDREGSTSYGEAERRAAARMSRTVKRNLYERLDSYFATLMAGK